jgi:hypothetical protein
MLGEGMPLRHQKPPEQCPRFSIILGLIISRDQWQTFHAVHVDLQGQGE